MFPVRFLSITALGALVASACGGEPGGTRVVRAPVSVLQASPRGPISRTVPIEFLLSEPVGDGPLDRSVAIVPHVPLKVRWGAQDRLTAIPTEPFAPNTRYVVRLLPTAVGPGYRLQPSEPLNFHLPLFAVDMVDAEYGGTPEAPAPLERVWMTFSHPVNTADLLRYVLLREDGPILIDIPFVVEGGGETCKTCALRLSSPARLVRVEVAAEMRPAVGGVSLEKRVVQRLNAAEPTPFRLLDAQPGQERGRPTLVLRGNRSVDTVPRDAVRIEPDVGHQVRTDGRRLVLTGPFEPEATYDVSVVVMEARDGTPLAQPFQATVTFPPLFPDLKILGDVAVLAPSDVDPIIVDSVAVRRLTLRTFSVPIDNLVHVIGDFGRPQRPRWPSMGRWTSLPAVPVENGFDGAKRTVVRLADAERPGLRLLEVRDADKPWLVDRRWVQAGWALTAKQGVEKIRVQVASAAKRRPVRGVEIRLRTRANHPIGPVLTDARGVATLPHSADDPVELVVATKGGDTALLDLRYSATRPDRGPLHRGDVFEAFILPSQDRFRREDPLSVLVIVRETGLAPVTAGAAVKLRMRGPAGRVWREQETQLWRSGGARFTLTWPPGAIDGVYTLELLTEDRVIGRRKIRLQGQQAVTNTAPQARLVQTSTGSARLSWTPERPRPGESLRVRWLAPAPGWATVSLESTDVHAQVSRRVGQGPSTFNLSVPAAAVPGAHLVVTFQPTGRGPAIEDRMYLEVGRRRPLRVSLQLPSGPHESGSEILATVQVRGVPEGSHVVVWAAAPQGLDEQLVADRKVFDYFYRYRPSSWRTHTPSGRYRQAPVEALDVPTPSAAPLLARGGAVMTDVIPIGKKGLRKVAITLPQRQGQLRVNAVVWSERRLGGAEATLEVRDALAIDAAVPSVLTENDTISLPVTVFRGPEGPSDIQLTAETRGGLQVVGTATRALSIPPASQTTARVRLKATSDGTLIFRATAADKAVAWSRKLPVQAAGPPSIDAVGARAPIKTSASLPWPKTPGRSRILVGTTGVYQLGAAITRLARDARDDLETAAARALVRQVVPDLSRPRGRSLELASVSGSWSNRLDAVDRCMGPDGPRAWPDGPPAEAQSIVLAGHAVVRAARRGLVSPNFDRWIEAVRTTARTGAATSRTIAHAQWVLALGRRPDAPMLEQLQAQWVNRPPDVVSGVGLAAGLVLAGRASAAAPLLNFSDAGALQPPESAFVLAALADAAPRHPVLPELLGQLVRALSGARRYGHRTDALALVGRAGLDGREAAKRPFWATLTMGSRQLRAFTGPGSAVIGDFSDATRAQGPIRLAVAGGATVFASLVVEGPTPRPDEGTIPVKAGLIDDDRQPVRSARRGDRMSLTVTVGPLPTTVPDLRVAIPIPSGLSVTEIESPAPQARVARDPKTIAFDLAATEGSLLQIKLRLSAAYAGDFSLGPVTVTSALRPRQRGASETRRLKVEDPEGP